VARAALDVTAALLEASPRVSWENGHGVWWVDAAGLGHEGRLAQRLLALANRCGYGTARVGIADSAIAAFAATVRWNRWRIIQSGRDAEFLAPFPVALLDLDEDLVGTLAALGIATVGQLAALEPGEVEARFGPEGLAAHRLARGLDARGPATPRDDTLPLVEVELGGPVATAEPLLFVLKGALATLGTALRGKGLAARELAVALALDDGSRAERAVRPARPTSHADVLFDHCRAALEHWPLPEPVVGVALRAAVTVPAAGEQGNLLAPRWADPAALEAAFDRIRSKEGHDAVAVPQACDGHLPEDAGSWNATRPSGRALAEHGLQAVPRRAEHGLQAVPRRAEHLQAVPKGCWRETATIPPSPAVALRRLGVPESIRVRLGRAGLEALKHGDTWHDIASWSGPERLTPRWWSHSGHPSPPLPPPARAITTRRARPRGTAGCCSAPRSSARGSWRAGGIDTRAPPRALRRSAAVWPCPPPTAPGPPAHTAAGCPQAARTPRD
jgi:protein ImuB